MRSFILILLALISISSIGSYNDPDGEMPYLSPASICCESKTGVAYVSLSTAGKIAVVDIKGKKLDRYIHLDFDPGGIALCNEENTLIISDKKPDGRVHFLDIDKAKPRLSIRTGHTPDALAVSRDGELLFVGNRFSNTISVITLKNFKLIRNIPVDREPVTISVSPDDRIIAVANHLPNTASTESYISAKISLIDREILEVVKHIGLAGGSHSIKGLSFSKDGKYLYASHVLSRNNQPTSQIEHGWINSNALSIIDIGKKEFMTSVLLDNYNKGAANPGNMVIEPDGSTLWLLLTGVHEICRLDLEGLHNKLSRVTEDKYAEIPQDLIFLRGIKQRISLNGKSPRNLVSFNNGLLVSSHFSNFLELVPTDNESGEITEIILGNEPEMNMERRGELLFCDADLCFQKWQSCTSCHPDARPDGLNWDLLNDGAGNPRNGKSMLYSHFTPPVMITGIRDKAETAVRSGIKYILFTSYEESDAGAIDAYLRSLKAVPSPFLVDGKLSDKAETGEKVFETAGCSNCHSGEYYTDGMLYNVGTGTESDSNTSFDVPTLLEVWRTAPYLYDGRAKTMKEVLSEFNVEDQHGITGNLSEEELECLVEYVLSL